MKEFQPDAIELPTDAKSCEDCGTESVDECAVNANPEVNKIIVKITKNAFVFTWDIISLIKTASKQLCEY